MSPVATPRLRRTSYSSSPKSSPTGPTTRTSQKKLAASEKCTAEPPSTRSRSPHGVLTAAEAIDPTTTRPMRRGRVLGLARRASLTQGRHMIRIAIIATAALALFVAPAGAKTFSAEQGAVKATVTYNKTAVTRLTIVRNGATLFDAVPGLETCGGAPCAPSGFQGDPPLRVLDLDGDSEPEVVYSAYSGGAHCCSIAGVFELNAQGTAYTMAEHNFFDPGFQIRTTASGPLFFTADDAFAYRFTAYAFSGLPI